MNIIELVEKLAGEYGLDLSTDSIDDFRKVFVDNGDDNQLVTDVSINSDGNVVLEVA